MSFCQRPTFDVLVLIDVIQVQVLCGTVQVIFANGFRANWISRFIEPDEMELVKGRARTSPGGSFVKILDDLRLPFLRIVDRMSGHVAFRFSLLDGKGEAD